MISPIVSGASIGLHLLDQLFSHRRAGQASSTQGANSTGQTLPSTVNSQNLSMQPHGTSHSLVSPATIALLNSLQTAGPQVHGGLASGLSDLGELAKKLETEMSRNASAASTIDQRLSSLATSALSTLSSTASVAATALSSGSSTAVASALDQLGPALQTVVQDLNAYRRV